MDACIVSLRLNGLRAVHVKTISNYIYCSIKNCQNFEIFQDFKLRENGLLLEIYANPFDLLTAEKVKFFIKDFVHCLSLKNNRKPKFSYCFQRDQKGSPKSLKSTPFLATFYCFCLCDCLFHFHSAFLTNCMVLLHTFWGVIFFAALDTKKWLHVYRYCQSYVVFGTGKSLLLCISLLQIFGVSVLFLLSRNIYSFQLMNFLVDPLTSNLPIPVAAEYRERGSRLTFACSKNIKNKNT